MKKSFLLLLLAFPMLITAQKSTKIKGNGNIITTNRVTAEYDKIIISGSFDTKLIAGKEGNITIKGDENIIPYLQTEVKNGVLEIKMERNTMVSYNYRSSLEITVPFTKIDEINFSGSGNLESNDPKSNDKFKFVMSGSGNTKFNGDFNNLNILKSGSGNLSVNGTATNLDITTSGSGNANLYNLIAENANATLSGSGNISVFCSKELNAKSAGSGSISYKGNPVNANKKSSGSGGIYAK